MDCTVHGILQARIVEWVAIPFSRGSSQPRDQTQVSRMTGRFFTSHQGSPRILEWVAYSFSSGSSQPRDRTGVSCIAGGFLTTELSGKPMGELNVPIKTMRLILFGSWPWFFGCRQQNWGCLNWVQYKSLQKKQIVMCLILRKCTYLWVRWYSL